MIILFVYKRPSKTRFERKKSPNSGFFASGYSKYSANALRASSPNANAFNSHQLCDFFK